MRKSHRGAIVAVLLAAGAAFGCADGPRDSDLSIPAIPSPSPADRAYEAAGLIRACHVASTGRTYGRNVKQVDDGRGRIYQIEEAEILEGEEDVATALFFDPATIGHPVTWLSEIACAADADRIAAAYDVPSVEGDPEDRPWLVVLDGAGTVLAERSVRQDEGPVQLSFGPTGDRLSWVGLDGSPRLWSWARGDDPLTIGDLALHSVSGAPGGGISWSDDGRFVAYSAWFGIGPPGGASIALVSTGDGRVRWERELDGDVMAWFDDGHLAWATAPWAQETEGEPMTVPTAIELWRMDEPAAEAGADASSMRVGVLELADEDAVARWFVERW